MQFNRVAEDRKHIRVGLLVRAGVVVAASLVVLLFAKQCLATNFQPYDDEGYFLISLDHYLHNGRLYDQTYSQYGPFYFYIQAAFFRLLQLPVSHDSGRLVTLICWLLSTGAAGYFIYRVSKDLFLASAAGLSCAGLAGVLANEPGHPQQFILPIFMLACCASMSLGCRRFGVLTLGALGTALLFMKINVGVFYFAALTTVLICSFPRSRIRTLGAGLMLAYAVAAPLSLMHKDVLGVSPWARGYCLEATLVGTAVFLAGSFGKPAVTQPAHSLLYAAISALMVAVLIVAGTMMQGMSPATLLEGVLWAPLRHPGVFSWAYPVGRDLLLGACAITGCLAALYWFRDRGWVRAEWAGALKCAVGLLSIYLLEVNPRNLVAVLPFLPLGLIPVDGREWKALDFRPRLFVACLAATQFLQPYPVSGSQIAVAAAPALLWAWICVHDGASGLLSLARPVRGLFGNGFPRESILGSLLALTLAVLMLHSVSRSRSYSYPPSHLRGAASLHIPAGVEGRYQFLASSIHENCDILFTLPGMASLNLWSGVPTPNGWNLGPWVKGFGLEKQQQILDILRVHPRACSVSNTSLAHYFYHLTKEDLEASPLARYLLHDMRLVGEKDGFEIRVHPLRNSPWLTVAASSHLPLPASATSSGSAPPQLFAALRNFRRLHGQVLGEKSEEYQP